MTDCATWGSDGLSDYYALDDYKSAFMKDDVDLYETVLAQMQMMTDMFR